MTTGTGTKADDVSMTSPLALLPAAERKAGRPFVVYVTSAKDKYKVAQDNTDKTTMGDERVALSAKLFTMVKADGDKIESTHPYAQHLGARGPLPRLVAYSADGTEIGRLEGSATPGKLFQLMKKTAAKDLDLNVDGFVKDYQRILTELDKLSKLQAALEAKAGQSQTVASKRDIAQKKEAYAKQEEELNAREKKLLDVKAKVAF